MSPDGRIRDLEVSAGPLGTVEADFAFEHAKGEEGFRFLAFLDRESVGFVTPGSGFSSTPLEAGEHEAVIAVLRRSWFGRPNLRGDVRGNRAYLTWNASTSPDCRRYRVYWDAGTGTVDTGTVLAEVDGIEGEEFWEDLAFAGPAGMGRLSVTGVYRGDAARDGIETLEESAGYHGNHKWRVWITSAGHWQYDMGSGLDGEDKEVEGGVGVLLPGGQRVAFAGGPADYAVGQYWQWQVGPRTWWVSGSLVLGSYKFQIRGVDGSGNEGALSSVMTVVINPEPGAPEAVAATWDAVTRQLTVTWEESETVLPAAVGYRVYTNYHFGFGELLEYVDEENRAGEIDAPGSTAVLTFPVAEIGEVKLYVRSVAADGCEERNAGMARVSCRAVARAVLGVPVITAVRSVAGGLLEVTWLFGRMLGDPAYWQIRSGATGDWDASGLEDEVAFADPASGGPVGEWAWTSGIAAGATWFGVLAVDGDGGKCERGVMVLGTPDGTAPGGTVGQMGWPT